MADLPHVFPPLNDGGLIEAREGNSSIGDLFRFPPLNDGGLIEA